MALLEEVERYTMTETLPLLPLWRYAQFYLSDPDEVSGVSLHPRRVQYLGEASFTADAPFERLHWGLPDPASGAASFEAVYRELAARINELIAGAAAD